MVGDIVGYARVVETPQNTRYFWGDISEIAGKEIPVWERNFQGDCMCFVDGKGLVDVDHTDIVDFRERKKPEDLMGLLLSCGTDKEFPSKALEMYERSLS